jgi:hypothetical protein
MTEVKEDGYLVDMQETVDILKGRLQAIGVRIEIEQSKRRKMGRMDWKRFDQAAMRCYVEMATMLNIVIGGE